MRSYVAMRTPSKMVLVKVIKVKSSKAFWPVGEDDLAASVTT